MSELDKAFQVIDRQNFESSVFGSIDLNESMHVDMADYTIIMKKKKSSLASSG